MEFQNYSPKIGNQILAKIYDKGWNVYKSTNSLELGVENIIRNYLTQKLELDERYVLLPKAENPKDPEQVMNALEKLAIRLNKQTPTIKINGERFSWTGFIPREKDIKVNTIIGHYISYSEFIEALNSIIQI